MARDFLALFHVEQRRRCSSIQCPPMNNLPVGRMERKMNKTMMIVASAVVAAATTWVPAAQAKGGGGGHHSGGGGGSGGMKFAAPAEAATIITTSRLFRRDTLVASGYKAEEAREKRIKLVVVPAMAPIMQLCRRQGSRVRSRQQGMVRRQQSLLDRQVSPGHSRTAPGSTAATAGTRPTAPGGPTPRRPHRRRLRDAAGIRQAEAHHRAADREQARR